MKLILIKSHIKDALTLLQKSWGENTNLPVLKNILIETGTDGITMIATNLEIATKVFISGKVIQPGSATIPFHVFSSLISNLHSERINIGEKNNNVEVTTDNYQGIIQGLPVADFPLVPKIKNTEQYIEIKNIVLKEGIIQTAAATQFSDIRPELAGIFFDFSLEKITLAATDSFRLAEKVIPNTHFTSTFQDGFRALIPLKTAHEVSRIFSDQETIRIYKDEHQILFSTAHTSLISRLTEGTFPDYSSVIPKKFSAETVVKKEELLDALKITSAMGGKTGEVKIQISPEQKSIQVRASDQSIGENTYTIHAEIKGKGIEVGFNSYYLIEGVKAADAPDIAFVVNQEENKAIIKGKGNDSYLYVVASLLKA